MRRNDWVVEPDGRHGGDKQCFYCKQPIGHQHAKDCVRRRRTIIVEFSVTMVQDVPEDWDAGMVEFHYNDSSWCASNLLDDLSRIDTDNHCLCPNISAQYVREATDEDEQQLGYQPADS